MAINSRNKGNKAERIAAKLIAKWTRKEFARTPSSGGLNWKSSHSKGDIVSTTEGFYFPFCIEVKHHKEINFEHLITPNIKNIKILEFWEQCNRDAQRANKIPLLIMRYDGLPKEFFFAVIPKEFYTFCVEPFCTSDNFNSLIFTNETLSLAIMPLEKMLKISYKTMGKIAKNYITNLSEVLKPLRWGDKGRYSISNRGYVIDNKYNNKDYGIGDSTGAKQTFIEHNGKGKRIRIYREVGIAFVRNKHNKPQVHHLCQDRSIADARNLSWGTQSENLQHRWDNKEAGIRIQKINPISGEIIAEYMNCNEAARAMGLGRTEAKGISKAVRGLRKKSYKFKWKKVIKS